MVSISCCSIALQAKRPSVQLSALENMHYSQMIRFDNIEEARYCVPLHSFDIFECLIKFPGKEPSAKLLFGLMKIFMSIWKWIYLVHF